MSDADAGRSSAALADFILLNEEIAALVRARLPLETHLRQMGAELPAKAGVLAKRIGERLSAGASLPDAIDAECGTMPAVYRATMLAGIESGNVGGAVESLVETASRMDELRRVTGAALVYPMIVIAVASVLFALIVTHVVPAFEWLNHPHFGPMVWLSRHPEPVQVAAVVAPFVVILLVVAWWWRTGRVRGKYPARFGVIRWLPGAQRVRRWSQAATFAEMLLLLTKSNVPLDRSLRLAAEAADNRKLRAAADRVADRVERGEPAWTRDSAALSAKRDDVPLLIRLALCYAGNRELFLGALRQAAALYRDRAIRAGAWYSEYAPILLTVGVGGVLTLVFTLVVLWPYISMLHELADWTWR
jgi:general secretion pathway protein F